MKHVLKMRGVTKRFGKRHALNGVDLDVPRGSIFGLVGSNGAGKTTTMAVISGFVQKDSGEVDVFGQGEYRAADHAGRMAVMPQDAALAPDACVGELLAYYGELQGMGREKARRNAREVIKEVNLSDRLNSAVRTLSHGMRQRVVLAQSFMGDPELILLDEPLSGLDPREVVHIRDFIKKMRGRRTILVSSHNLHEIERMCDHVAFIENGKTLRQDALGEITRHNSVLNYTLDSRPPDIKHLQSLLPDAALELDEKGDRCILVCRFDGEAESISNINEKVIRQLFEQRTGLIDVQQGDGLEEAYLRQGAQEYPISNDQ